MPEDGRDIAVAEEHHRRRDDDGREARPEHDRPRAPDERKGDERRGEERPAEQVVQERGAREEPRVLLVDDEREPADRKGKRPCQSPKPRMEPAVSVPIAAYPSPAATAAAEPPEDPPEMCARFQGLRTGP